MTATIRTLQRTEVPIVRQAIAKFVGDGTPTDGSYYEIDGYTVLVSQSADLPAYCYGIGLYLPGSTPEGTCDGYWVCTADGETAT